MKRLLKAMIFSMMLLCACAFNNVYASVDMDKLDIEAHVNSDGSMDVIEKWKVYIDETNTLFKNWNLNEGRFSGITNVSVKDLRSGAYFEEIYQEQYHVDKGCFYALDIDGGNKFEVAWGVGMDNTSGTREYELRYTVKDAILIHNDCAELYWKFVGESFEVPIDKMSGVVYLPGNYEKEDIKVWGHTNTLSGTIYPTEANSAIFELEDIPSNEYVEVRIAFPKDGVYSGRMDFKDAVASIQREETIWADAANARREQQKKVQTGAVGGISLVVIIALIIQFINPIKVLKSDRKKKI